MHTTYQVDVEIVSPPGTSWNEEIIHFKSLTLHDEAEVKKYVKLFHYEFFKYPFEFIKNTKLKKIVLVKELYNSGVPVAAMPDYYQEYLYIDIYEGHNNHKYQRHVIHHEFYHMIEEEFNGNTYYKDPEWNAFNVPGFQYGNGGINNRGSHMSVINHPDSGFINLYSQTGLEEDKAEIFGSLMTDNEKELVLSWTIHDKILQLKVDYMVRFLKKHGLTIHINP